MQLHFFLLLVLRLLQLITHKIRQHPQKIDLIQIDNRSIVHHQERWKIAGNPVERHVIRLCLTSCSWMALPRVIRQIDITSHSGQWDRWQLEPRCSSGFHGTMAGQDLRTVNKIDRPMLTRLRDTTWGDGNGSMFISKTVTREVGKMLFPEIWSGDVCFWLDSKNWHQKINWEEKSSGLKYLTNYVSIHFLLTKVYKPDI